MAAVIVGLLLVAGALFLAFVADRVADEMERSFGVADTADYEVVERECTLDAFDDALANGEITNTSDRSHVFRISVRFVDSDGSLLTRGSTSTSRLDPGESTSWEVVTFSEPAGGFTCELDEVRYENMGG